MLEAMKAMAERSVLERVLLFANHVIAAEPAAAERLKPHAGRTISIEPVHWPALLPAPDRLVVRVTPAGLVERVDDAALIDASSLRVVVDASNPARLAARWSSGDRSDVDVAGDDAFAADVRWLLANLRWDAREDLARVVGDAPAESLARAGTAIARTARDAADFVRERTAGWRRP